MLRLRSTIRLHSRPFHLAANPEEAGKSGKKQGGELGIMGSMQTSGARFQGGGGGRCQVQRGVNQDEDCKNAFVFSWGPLVAFGGQFSGVVVVEEKGVGFEGACSSVSVRFAHRPTGANAFALALTQPRS